jgi:hypothetical protein
MSSITCCPISANDGDGPSCSSSEIRKARKSHICYECRGTISPGERYKYESGIWDGRADSFKTCLLCIEIRDHFSCGGWLYGQMWSDLRENFFPNMTAGGPCMDGLSPEAKQRLIDARMAWYFAQDEIDDSAWEDWPKHRDRQRPPRVVREVEEQVPYYETPEFYWKRELELDAFRTDSTEEA